MAGKSEGGETLHEQRNLTPEEIEERTKAKLKADAEESQKVHDELDAANKKTAEQAKKEAEEVKADEEKKEAAEKKAAAAPSQAASSASAPGHARSAR